MKHPLSFHSVAALCAGILPLFSASNLYAEEGYIRVRQEASTQAGELSLEATYTLWIPEGLGEKKLRGMIVHQHGCGEGASKGGQTGAYDLHWQALARKWDFALLAPVYHPVAPTLPKQCRDIPYKRTTFPRNLLLPTT